MSTDEPLDCDLKVTFFPPLHLQRRIWVLNVLRRERVTSVLDVGCGEGELLHVLIQPASWLAPSPAVTTTPTAHLTEAEILNLHPTHIHGLDISSHDLQFAIEGIQPRSSSDGGGGGYGFGHGHDIRWEEVEVCIWKGGLEVPNDVFVGIECIVAMEVIEHLPATILPYFAPILLGVYHPTFLLLTTPSYTFNARFSPPTTSTTDTLRQSGYLDPTHRTDRVFRHHDHKFEWTVEEFRAWCEDVAEEWGYEIAHIGAVGYALEEDEWGRDAELGGASQVVEFRRKDDDEWVGRREERAREWRDKSDGKEKHELLAKYLHEAHEGSKKPGSLEDIGEAIKTKMESLREVFMRMEELWFEPSISVLCGGWIELMVEAVEKHEKLRMHKEDEGKRSTWRVELIGGVRLEVEEYPPEEEEYFPEVSGEWEMKSGSIPSSRVSEHSFDDDADVEEEGGEEQEEGGSSGELGECGVEWDKGGHHTWTIPEEEGHGHDEKGRPRKWGDTAHTGAWGEESDI